MRIVPLIFISALALLFTQCTVKPSKRSHNNAVGIWFGGNLPENEETATKSFILGANYKYVASHSGLNGSLNLQPGIIFGDRYGINFDASIRALTNDLVANNNSAFQLYVGPGAGFSFFSRRDKMPEFNPNLGVVLGCLILFPAYKNYPESDLSVEASADMKHRIKAFKEKEEMSIGRVLYNVYLF
ncbi:hypothetical protein R83H12_02190 [Fibrobacteria bacterium R8-3-H12]